MIAMDVLDPDDSAEDGSIKGEADPLNKENKSGSTESSVSTCVTEVGTKEAEEVQQHVKYSSL